MFRRIILTLSLTALSCHTLTLDPKSTGVAKLKAMTSFMKDMKRDYLDLREHRQITVLARNINLLRAISPLYQDYPIYTGEHANITRSQEYSNVGYVFIFVDNWQDDYLNVCLQDLPNTYNAKIILVLIGTPTTDEITKIYDMAYTTKTVNILVINFDGTIAQLYRSRIIHKTCTRRAKLVGNWSIETGLRMQKLVFFKTMNYHTCPVRIITLNLEPVMRIMEAGNETLKIVGGLEGKIILTFAHYMNFTPIVKYPRNKDWISWKPNSTESGLIDELIMGEADIGVGQLCPTHSNRLELDFSFTYNYECLTWTVPLIIDWNKNVLFSEFSVVSWSLIILIIILSAMYQHISYLMHRSNLTKDSSFFFSLFQSFSATVGHPVPISVQKSVKKLHYTLYLIYALIITVAYKTSLAQQLTLRLAIPMILNEQEIIDNQLRIAGPGSFLQILKDQTSENHLAHKLVKRYETLVDADEAAKLISTEKNLAYIRHRSTMDYIRGKYLKSGKTAGFYTFPDTCVISCDPVMLMSKGSPLLISLNLMIRKLREFGIPAHWKNSDAFTEKVYTLVVYPQKFTIQQLYFIFLIYLFGMLLSSIAFILELIYKSNSNRNIIAILKRDAQLIKTDADIASSKLIPGGSSNMLSILESQRDESPYMPYLIEHYEVLIGNAAALDRIKYKKDFAFAFDISTMQYYARNLTLARKEVYFYSFDKCIVSYHKIILVRKGSALTAELNDIIKRLQESGLIKLWKNEKGNVHIGKEHDVKLQKLNLMQVQSIFVLYLSGIILSTIVLIFEIIFSSLSKRRN